MPDLRGLFLRGYGSQTHTQNNGSTIGVTSTTHSSGALGQIQGDAIRNAEGSSGTFQGFSDANYVGALTRLSFWFHGSVNEDNPGWYAHKFGINLSRVVPTANENRPVNMAVRYLIRALP
ncbi:hypothetical protein [Selenomonas ruminantium]|uniref:hypothetical protein n=1 Tax=Selenomonas ruminantium TaxID=971 RepID=UPI0026F198B8|nr:hypothetical protein [Selenomonas ruminantium]